MNNDTSVVCIGVTVTCINPGCSLSVCLSSKQVKDTIKLLGEIMDFSLPTIILVLFLTDLIIFRLWPNWNILLRDFVNDIAHLLLSLRLALRDDIVFTRLLLYIALFTR